MSARPVAVVATAAALLACAACGSSGSASAGAPATTAAPATTTSAPDAALDPAKIEATVLAAATSAHAVHVKGSEVQAGDTATIDLQLNADSASGTVTDQGVTFPVMLVNKVYYLEFTAPVLKSQGIDPAGAAGKKLVNKWVPSTSKVIPADTFDHFKEILDYTTFIKTEITVDQDKIARTGTDTLSGAPVVVFHDSTQNTNAYVSAASPHYLLRETAPGGSDLTLSGWDQTVPVTAPAKADIFTG